MWLSRRIGWLLYQLAVAAGMALAAPFLLVRRGRHYLATLTGRLGFYRDPGLREERRRRLVSLDEL